MQAEHVDGVFIETEGRPTSPSSRRCIAGMNIKAHLLDYVQPPDSFQNSTAKPVCGGRIPNSNAD